MKTEELKTLSLVFLGAMVEIKIDNKNYLNRTYIKDKMNFDAFKQEELLQHIRQSQK